jgi:hypothetical protein
MEIENVKAELESKFPEYSFSVGKRPFNRPCIIVKNTKYSGADVFIKDKSIVVEAAIPEMTTRMWIGSGVLFLKLFNKRFSEPSKKISRYLQEKYEDVRLSM